jgi:CO/xanthine dehydrogenase FAD-binding subunit
MRLLESIIEVHRIREGCMKAFDYCAPRTVAEAIGFLADTERPARPFAGGTDLLVQLRGNSITPSPGLLVDVKKIPGMTDIHYVPDRGLTIGAAATCAALCIDEVVGRRYRCLTDGVSLIGGRAIRERATIGGNLCNAAPSADAIPPLIVLNAVCSIVGPEGPRTLPVEEICVGPGVTALRRGEILVSIAVPVPAPHAEASYLRFTPRHEMDIAVAGVAAAITLNDRGDRIENARIALSAVGPTPLVADNAAKNLIGKAPCPTSFEDAGVDAAALSDPISDVRGPASFRRHMIKVLTVRALSVALDRFQRQGGEG